MKTKKVYDHILKTFREVKVKDDKVNGKEAEWRTIKGHHIAVGEGGEVVAGGVPGTNIGAKQSGNKIKPEKKNSSSKIDQSWREELRFDVNADYENRKVEENKEGHTLLEELDSNEAKKIINKKINEKNPSEMSKNDYNEMIEQFGFSKNDPVNLKDMVSMVAECYENKRIKDIKENDKVAKKIKNALRRGIHREEYSNRYSTKIKKSELEEYKKRLNDLGFTHILYENNPYVHDNLFFADETNPMDHKLLK